MINMAEFMSNWGECEYVQYRRRCLETINIDETGKQLLDKMGIPIEAAPYLTFSCNIGVKGQLSTAAEMWGISNKYLKYYIIGSTGSGDSICIEEQYGHVVYLDHENEFAECLINTSVEKLLHCLLVYRKYIKRAKAERGDSAWLNNISKDLQKWLKIEIEKIDKECLHEGCFWSKIINE